MRFAGKVWRYVPADAHPLHAWHILASGGRWNRAGRYGCLYTALNRQGALAEYQKRMRATAVPADKDKPRDLVSIEVVVEPVLDTSDAEVRARLGVSLATLSGNEENDLEVCRTIADWALIEPYRAILAPSSAAPGDHNLAIYLVPGIERLEVGPDRIPINYGIALLLSAAP